MTDADKPQDPTEGYDPVALDEMMRVAAEHDPEVQRERIREKLQIVVHDAMLDDHVDPPVAVTVTESSVLVCDPLDDTDYCWTVRWEGGDTARLVAPDGETEYELPLEDAEPQELGGLSVDETFQAFGKHAQSWHLRRRIREFHNLRETGQLDDRFADEGSFLLPVGKLGLRADGLVAVYGPEYEVDQVIAAEDVEAETVEAAEERWREQMREKYEGTPMEEEF